jgi:outer membrane protein
MSSPGAADIYQIEKSHRNYTLALTQKLFDFSNIASLSSAKASAKAATATFAAATQDLISRTAASYFNVLEKQDLIRFSKASVQALKREHERARARFEVGLDTITNVYQAQARYEAMRATLIANENSLLDAKESLHEITGKYYDQLNNLQITLDLKKPTPDDLNFWTQEATQHNFTNIAAQFNTQAAHQLVKQAFGGHLPTLDLTSSYSHTHTTYKDIAPLKTHELQEAIQLSIPIFSGGYTSASTQQAQYDYQKALANQDQNQRAVFAQTHRDYYDIMASLSKIAADKRAVKANISALKGAKAELKVGTKTLLDVLTQQENLLDAQSAEASDLYHYLNDNIRLAQDAGSLSIDNLRIINAWLAPIQPVKKTKADHDKT